MTNRFLDELRSTNWRLESPTAAMMPNMTQKRPPMMGEGMVRNRAPTLFKTPNNSMMTPAHWTTRLLPTCRTAICF